MSAPQALPPGEPDASAAQGLEPYGGNLYRPHLLQVHRGRFWRCKHGETGYASGMILDTSAGATTGMVWKGCPQCEADDPQAHARWHSHP